MIRGLLNWLDDRTRCVSFSRAVLYESIPGGARWRYVWGNTVLFAFVVQLITGFFLWAAYSPSTQTAWESTYYIQHQMTGGWLLRAIHHYMAQAVVILIALHIFQMVIDSAYRAPREVNFWVAIAMLLLVVFFSITGWLLPWDQRGFFGSKIPTNLILLTPGVGPYLRGILIGGSEYGTHHTLTRFFSLHVGLLPWIMLVVFWIRSQQNRRHGQFPATTAAADGRVEHFWPDQFLRNMIACLAVTALVLFLSMRHGLDPATRGVPLTAPADPSQEFSAARPELPFLWLFQMLKYFPGEREVYGAIVLPGAIMFALVMMPIVGRWRLGRGFNITLICAIGICIVTLTAMSLWEDRKNATYSASVKQANESGARVVSLASGLGVPPTGALSLARNDPFLQGPLLFKQHCAACHRHGDDPIVNKLDAKPTAPNLEGFASREWIAGLMDPKRIKSEEYFGNTAHKEGEMAEEFVNGTMQEYDDAKRAALGQIVIALSAEAKLKSQRTKDAADFEAVAAGRLYLTQRTHQCAKCHKFGDTGGKSGPDLTGYGSRQWTIDFVKNPAHERFYGKSNDRMPQYEKQLDDRSIGLIVDWLRGEWYVPGEPPFAPPTTRPASRPTTASTTRP